MSVQKIRPDIVCEASWEVCNKAGGIYTVITSKVGLMQAHYDSYYCIGPLFDSLPREFIPQQPPESLDVVFGELSKKGIRCEYGLWDVKGHPATILIDARSIAKDIDAIKTSLWELHGIDSLNASFDFNEPLVWSWGVGMFFEELERYFTDKKIIAHCHEWLAGFALCHLKNISSSIARVFTTHATMLGRTLSGTGTWIYDSIESIDADNEAKRLGISEKHTTEKACAHAADVFTTVSEITAREAEHFFGVTPDLLENGLLLDNFPSFEEASSQHALQKHKLQEYLTAHFYPYIHPDTNEHNFFDLDNTLLFYSSGRYEYSNKGFDITMEALGQLNNHLKESGSKKTVIQLFFLALDGNTPSRELLENKSYIQELASEIKEHSKDFVQRTMANILTDSSIDIKPISDEEFSRLKREYTTIIRHKNPPFSTHDIPENDNIIKACHQFGLENRPEDRVKIIIIPTFLDGHDGLINMNYYEAVSACHLGIFPSYYEPWGYTPLESVSMGVPAITSSVAGFGKYMSDKIEGEQPGLYVVSRQSDNKQTVAELYSIFSSFVSFSRKQRVSSKIRAHALSSYADWKQLIKNYIAVHQKALKQHS